VQIKIYKDEGRGRLSRMYPIYN